MMNRRDFLGAAAAGTVLAPSAVGLVREIGEHLARDDRAPEEIARDEDFWRFCQEAWTVDRSVVNLNNGGVAPSPRIVQEAMQRHLEYANTFPSAKVLLRANEEQREAVRARLAAEWGVDAEEIALTRNSSESLQTCQFGMDLRKGDEVLTTTQDYGRMVTTFKQRVRREGIALKQVKIPTPCEDPGEIVRIFREALTASTKMILVCHVINITGQIMPVRAIVEMARGINGGIPVVVDGAHAMAQIDFKLPDLACDYYGVSLHKWLSAPHGTGLLYVRKERIKGLWPLMAADTKQDGDIRKFEEIGTHPLANHLAIAEALTFHQAVGGKRKEARLRHLRDSWAKRLLASPRVRLHTSLRPEFSCAIGTVQVAGVDTAKLGEYLWDKHRIFVTPIKHDEFEGMRVTANLYTTMEEIDRFCGAVEGVIRNGLPAAAPA